jgi:hypothetical protein
MRAETSGSVTTRWSNFRRRRARNDPGTKAGCHSMHHRRRYAGCVPACRICRLIIQGLSGEAWRASISPPSRSSRSIERTREERRVC